MKRLTMIVVIIFAVMICGCGKQSEDKRELTKPGLEDSNCVEDISTEHIIKYSEEAAASEQKEANNQELIDEIILETEGRQYFKDYYLKQQLLIIADNEVYSVFLTDDYKKVSCTTYSDIVRVDTNIVGEIACLAIIDKTGDSFSFIFTREEATVINEIIASHRECN